MPTDDDSLLTAAEVATRLRTKPIVVVRKCRDGEIPAAKVFGRWLISAATVDALVAENSNQQDVA